MLFYLLINCSKLIFGKIVSVINPLLDAKEIFELTQMFAYKHHIKRLVFIKLSFDFSTFLAFSKCSIIDQGSIFVRVACPLIFVGQFFYVSYAQNLQLKKLRNDMKQFELFYGIRKIQPFLVTLKIHRTFSFESFDGNLFLFLILALIIKLCYKT